MSRTRLDPRAERATRPSSQAQDPISPSLEFLVEREAGVPMQRSLVLSGDVLRIGSNAGNELVLNDPTVSRVHCKIRTSTRGWQIVDTGSLNGTLLDGVRVRDADLARSECTLVLGESQLRIRLLPAKEGLGQQQKTTFALGALYGQSPIMRRVFSKITKIAKADGDVLIEGESGTGKELVAAEIVRRSSRADKPFIIIDCAGLSRARVELELFGAMSGAFPGIKELTPGAFEAAKGGTVLLDEVADLPVDIQPMLLRALSEREVRRVGSHSVVRFDARVIATTNRRIEDAINHGQFREDLYFRLGALRMDIPPLRERTEDLPLLVGAILDELMLTEKLPLFTEDVYRAMAEQPWPGNVRELRNFVERRVITDEFDAQPEPAPSREEEPGASTASTKVVEETFRAGKDRIVSEFERRYLKALFEWSGGNVSRAARKAGLDRMYLHRLLQRHGIKRDAALD